MHKQSKFDGYASINNPEPGCIVGALTTRLCIREDVQKKIILIPAILLAILFEFWHDN